METAVNKHIWISEQIDDVGSYSDVWNQANVYSPRLTGAPTNALFLPVWVMFAKNLSDQLF